MNNFEKLAWEIAKTYILAAQSSNFINFDYIDFKEPAGVVIPLDLIYEK